MKYFLWENFIVCLNVFIISVFVCETSYAQQFNYNKRCGKFDWQCKNGDCIALDELCDGKFNCRDRSDETAESCIHVQCPSYAFRCAYGACVNGNAECDGVQDCVDNSDETSISCPGVVQKFKLSGNCSDEYFQCVSGKCIPIDNACDGKPDCNDASDETVKICSSTHCPSFAFRCGYGACISGIAKCDGIKDCFDGSDESVTLCGINHVTEKPYEVTETPSTRPSSALPPTQSGCFVDYIDNLIFVYDSNHDEQIRPGNYVDNLVSIAYKCSKRHLLNGVLTNYCLNGRWLSDHPTCEKYCSNIHIVGRATIQAVCEYKGQGIPCNQAIKPGTIAKISCKVGYEKPDRVLQEIIVCGDDGEWDYFPFRCEQVCGTEPVQTHQFIIGGEKINNTLVPWHTAIYQLNNDRRYDQICGGTIINARVILSAAHCFWNAKTERPFDKSLFSVGVGKYHRDYYDDEPLLPQFFNLTELHIPDSYQDTSFYFQNDIAVLVLEGFIEYKIYIKPICIEFHSYSNRSVKSNILGRVAGWGKLENDEPSNDLRVVDLPTISYDECIEKTLQEFRKLVTGDKFCVGGAENEQSVCEGDSGGGFVIPKIVGDVKTYFLWGIVSNGLNTKGQCKGNYFTAFTNIQYHSKMITEYESKYRPK